MNKQQLVSQSYARALTEVSEELKISMADELTKFWEVVTKNNDFENLLFLDVFTVEERLDTSAKVLDKIGAHQMVKNFILFLITEKRINLLPQIYKDIVIADDLKKGFITGSVEGSGMDVDKEMLEKLKKYLESSLNLKTKLTYKKNEKISAGYKVTVGDLQLDATLENQLNEFKKQVLQN